MNFDLSMQYFASLDRDEFEDALQHVLVKGRTFKPVQSLADWDDVAGAYIMVFDEYKQFYVGQSEDIRKSIRTHWATRKPFDRLIFGDNYESIFPVDEFRAFDNTRVYTARSRNPYAVEERAEKAADPRFCLNRMSGGEADPWRLLVALSSPRSRTHGPGVVEAVLSGLRVGLRPDRVPRQTGSRLFTTRTRVAVGRHGYDDLLNSTRGRRPSPVVPKGCHPRRSCTR